MDKILFFYNVEENIKYSFLLQNILINKSNINLSYNYSSFFSIFGMIIFILRRTIIFFITNILIKFLVLCGIYGSIKINSIFLLIQFKI